VTVGFTFAVDLEGLSDLDVQDLELLCYADQVVRRADDRNLELGGAKREMTRASTVEVW